MIRLIERQAEIIEALTRLNREVLTLLAQHEDVSEYESRLDKALKVKDDW